MFNGKDSWLDWYVIPLLLLASCQQIESIDSNSKPNIIIILADDMGFADLGCTGSEIHTPNLDALANEGILFTNCYNTSRCCPTRASLMTGLYQHQAGYGHMDADLGYAAYQGRFRKGIPTIAQLMKKADYRTIMLGKWHLGDEPKNAPLGRGFDRMYGIPKGGGVYFFPCIGRDRQVYLNDSLVVPDSNWYSTDAFTDYAIEIANESIRDEKPFFMYLAYIAPHFPLQARAEDISKYSGTYMEGYEAVRDARFKKQQELGLWSSTFNKSPGDLRDWSGVVDQEQEDLKMAVYAAQVDRMDQNIGRLVSHLKARDQWDNTVIIFLSDNGGTDVKLNTTPEAEIGSRNSWSSYGRDWANVSNVPYRKYKAETHEGGIITPLIFHWPKGTKEKGVISNAPIHIVDVVPTCLEIAGLDLPSSSGLEMIQYPGQSVMPILHSDQNENLRKLFWEHEGNRAIRIGDWKLVQSHNESWELYNLALDPTELLDLSTQYPQKADTLKEAFFTWAEEQGVQKWPIKGL